jgi:hypothetical protein
MCGSSHRRGPDRACYDAGMRRALIVMSVVCCVACGNKRDKHGIDIDSAHAAPAAPAPGTAPPANGSAATGSAVAAVPTGGGSAGSAAPAPATPPVVPAAPDAPAGNPPPDGKYEHVMVEGVTVPMVNVMNGGTVVLVDTDGKKPRTWEEQYKKKSAKLAGQFDIHKTDANKNGKFEDDAVDREGLWLIDAKGNITRH